jgi:ankyrin repeat protein
LNCNTTSCITADGFDNTPLIFAADHGDVEVVRVLLEAGVDVDRSNSDKNEMYNVMRTALHYAAFRGHLEVCRLLLDWGAKVDSVGGGKSTALHIAAREGRLSVVKLLEERGADVRLKDGNGETAPPIAWNDEHEDVDNWLDLVSRV